MLVQSDYTAIFEASPDALLVVDSDIRDIYGVTINACLARVGGELDPLAALALYRIAQEAVTNVVRHAGVDEVFVTLSKRDGLVTTVVRDEGCGFDPPDPEAVPADGGGVGLVGMLERAALVSGTVAVQASPGKGTTVRASVPITDTEGDGE